MAVRLLQPGSDVPFFSVENQNGDIVTPDDIKSTWAVVYFYPKDNTPGCSVEATSFSLLRKDFHRARCVVFGVSADSCDSHRRFIEKKDLTIQLLSDPDKKMYKAFGVSGRTTFLTDPNNMIVKVWENVKPAGHAEDVLATLKRLQTLAL